MPRRVLLFVLLALGALAASTAAAQAATYPAGFQEETLISGLTQPMAVDWTPDGRRIVIEKSGVVKVAAPGATTATPIDGLNLSARVNSNHDRGLLGLAVDIDYAINNYVYFLYTYDLTPGPTTGDSGGAAVSQLLRVKLSLTNEVLEQKVILGTYTSGPCPAPANNVDCIPSDYDSHSIGTVRQFRDGTLFVGSGDGASYNEADPRALRALNEQSMAGKILNVDRDGKGRPGAHPFCPANTNLDDVCTKVWARGLRNPFRFEVRYDRALNIGDVGWGTTEELDIATQPGGQSFGWPCYEGTARTGGYQTMAACQAEYAKPAGTHTDPVLSWCHCGNGGSALGGPTYFPGGAYPTGYRDTTFYGDYVRGWIKRAVPNGSGGFTSEDFATGWLGVQLTQERGTGDLVYVTPGNFGSGQGSVRAVRYTAGNKQPVARIVADKTSGLAPLTVNFDATTSTDADNDPLTYTWLFGDGTSSTEAKPSKTFTTPGTYTVRLTVSDNRGVPAQAETTITVGSDTPRATITSPQQGEIGWVGGKTITLTGTGTDDQDGTLPDSALTWQVLLHHGEHVHPYVDLTGKTASFTARDDHDADSYYEIRLTAKDSSGLTDTARLTIGPTNVDFEVRSEPAGAPINWAGFDAVAPWTAHTAAGFRPGLTAAERFTRDDKTYVFDRWSDGGARSHTITVPEENNSKIVAYYREEATPPASSLVLALGFDEASGTTSADKSGRGNTAKLERGAKFTSSGRYGGALDLDGAQSWATVADATSLDLTGAMTLEAWVKPRNRSSWRTVLMKELGDWQSYALYSAAEPYGGSGTGGEPVGFVDADGVRGPAPLPLNAWSHLALTFDGTTERLYVDGALVASRPSTRRAQVGTGPLRIGGNAMWGEHFDGLIDDVRVYERALTATEVAADRDVPVGTTSPQPQPVPTPVAAYGFDEASGATTADSSPNAAVAQVSGAKRIAAGKRGRALDFDGTNDRVIAPDAPQLRMTGPMTLSAWVKPDTVSQWRTVLLKENTANGFQDYALYAAADPYQEDGQYNEPAGFVSGLGVRGPKLPVGTWSHLAFVFDGGGERLFINGTLAGSRVFGFNPLVPSGAGPLSIGGNGLWGEWFDGAIDEVRLFNSALTRTQIVADIDRTAATARATAAGAKVTLKRAGVVKAKADATRAAKAKATKGRKAAKRMTVLRGKRAAVTVKRGDRKARGR